MEKLNFKTNSNLIEKISENDKQKLFFKKIKYKIFKRIQIWMYFLSWLKL